jgi:hypothetical protein
MDRMQTLMNVIDLASCYCMTVEINGGGAFGSAVVRCAHGNNAVAEGRAETLEAASVAAMTALRAYLRAHNVEALAYEVETALTPSVGIDRAHAIANGLDFILG